MLSLVDNVARRLLRRGLRRGLIEGNIWWLCVGAAAGVVRLLFKAEAPKIQRETLGLGETITVTHRPAEIQPRTRRSRSSEAR
jgi:hypothetical protein